MATVALPTQLEQPLIGSQGGQPQTTAHEAVFATMQRQSTHKHAPAAASSRLLQRDLDGGQSGGHFRVLRTSRYAACKQAAAMDLDHRCPSAQSSVAFYRGLFSFNCEYARLAIICSCGSHVLLGVCAWSAKCSKVHKRIAPCLTSQLIFTPLYYAYAPNRCSTVRSVASHSTAWLHTAFCRALTLSWTPSTSV